MGNEFKGLDGHSAEWFGDSRDYWWNDDYLTFTARRLGFDGVRSVLDVGCGVGHWGRLLASVLPEDARVSGIDPDPFWVQKATERAARAGLGERFDYRAGRAEELPFADASFDLVTCQTVLMHVRDPALAVREMIRVAKPGGLVLAAEANNVYGPVLFDAFALEDDVEETAALFRFQLLCQRGKRALGEGDSLVGDRVAGFFTAAGLEDVATRQNDHVEMLLPPYATAEERAELEEVLDSAERGMWIWKREEALRYYSAGGGTAADFEALHDRAVAQRARVAAALRAGTYSACGGGLFYLVSGRKPLAGT